MNKMEMDVPTLANESLKLAKAMDDYTAAYVFAAVALLVFVVFVIFSLRQQRKTDELYQGIIKEMTNNLTSIQQQFVEQMTANISMLVESSKKINEFFQDSSLRKVSIDQARALIEEALDRSISEIVLGVIEVKKNNNLIDRAHVEKKIRDYIENAYSKNVSFLRKFEFSGKLLSNFLESKWRDEVYAKATSDCIIL